MWWKFNLLRIIFHEASHAIVAFLVGMNIKEIKIVKYGTSHVIHSGSNKKWRVNLVTLSPYILFIPTITTIILYMIFNCFDNMKLISKLIMIFIGFLYCFQLKFLYDDIKSQFMSIKKEGFQDQDLSKVGLTTSMIVILISQIIYIIILTYLIGV
jgi:hypothetical protein